MSTSTGLYAPASPRRSVYIAAPWPMRETAERLAQRLHAHGVPVTSTWHQPGAEHEDGDHVFYAKRNAEDLEAADALVALYLGEGSKGGRDFEFGYAVAAGKDVLLVGEPPHIFSNLARVKYGIARWPALRVRGLSTARYFKYSLPRALAQWSRGHWEMGDLDAGW